MPSFFHTKSLKSSVYFPFIVYLILGFKFSSKILDLCLDFIKCTVEKEDSSTKFVPNMLKCLQWLSWISASKSKLKWLNSWLNKGRTLLLLDCTSHISSAHLPRVANGRHIGHPSPDPQGSSQTRGSFHGNTCSREVAKDSLLPLGVWNPTEGRETFRGEGKYFIWYIIHVRYSPMLFPYPYNNPMSCVCWASNSWWRSMERLSGSYSQDVVEHAFKCRF